MNYVSAINIIHSIYPTTVICYSLRKHDDIILRPVRETVSATATDDAQMIVGGYPSLDEGAKVSQRAFDVMNQDVIGRLQQGLYGPDMDA